MKAQTIFKKEVNQWVIQILRYHRQTKNKVPAIQTETEKESTTLFICFARFSGDPDFLLRTDVWDHHCF